MLRVCRTVAPVVVLLCLFVTGAFAQGLRASISGIIQDPTGAAIPSAVLSLRSLGTSAVAKTTSGSGRFYSFPNLVPGAYDLSVTAKGFRGVCPERNIGQPRPTGPCGRGARSRRPPNPEARVVTCQSSPSRSSPTSTLAADRSSTDRNCRSASRNPISTTGSAG